MRYFFTLVVINVTELLRNIFFFENTYRKKTCTIHVGLLNVFWQLGGIEFPLLS